LADLDPEEQHLARAYQRRVAGSRRTDEIEERRAWMALDWYARPFAGTWLRLGGLGADATEVESTTPITDDASLEACTHVTRRTRRSIWEHGPVGSFSRWNRDPVDRAGGRAAEEAAGRFLRPRGHALTPLLSGTWSLIFRASYAASRLESIDLEGTVHALQAEALGLLEAILECGSNS